MSTSSFSIKELIHPTLLCSLRHSFNKKEKSLCFQLHLARKTEKKDLYTIKIFYVLLENIYPHNTYHMLFVKYTATFRSGVNER